MDDSTEALLRELQSSPTDLRKLVVNTIFRSRSEIAIESEAIARWRREDPARWAAVQEWLGAHGVKITVVTAVPPSSSGRVTGHPGP